MKALIYTKRGKSNENNDSKLANKVIWERVSFASIRSNRQILDHSFLTNDNQAIYTPEEATQACAFRCNIEHYHHRD